MAADQVAAEDKEKIDTDPAEAIEPAGKFESKKCGVVNDDHDNRERAEKIETRLAFAILKARIDYRLAHGSVTLTSVLSRARERKETANRRMDYSFRHGLTNEKVEVTE